MCGTIRARWAVSERGRGGPRRVPSTWTCAEDLGDALLQVALLDRATDVSIRAPLLQRPGEDATDHALPVDEVGHRQSEQAILVAHLAVHIDRYRELHTELIRERPSDRLSFLHIYRNHNQAILTEPFICRDELGHLLAAGRAPGGPKVEHDRLPAQRAQAHLAAVEGPQQEVRRQPSFLGTNVEARCPKRRRKLDGAIPLARWTQLIATPRLQPPDRCGDCADDDQRQHDPAENATRAHANSGTRLERF